MWWPRRGRAPACSGALPSLLADDPEFAASARALAAKSFELTSSWSTCSALKSVDGAVSAQASPITIPARRCASCKCTTRRGNCSSSVDGLVSDRDGGDGVCCGFGGAFSVKYPDISTAIGDAKAQTSRCNPAPRRLLGGDLGCLLHIAGKLVARGLGRVPPRRGSSGRHDRRARHRASAQGGVTD